MSKRITIMIDDELDKKLRIMQAKEIQRSSSSVSYSKMLNSQLRASLKKQ